MVKRIIVLSDTGTWETVGDAEVWTVTDEAFEKLCEGEEPKHLAATDIIDTKEIQ